MLRFWHVCLLVLIALIWKVRPTSSTADVCETGGTNFGVYCNCEYHRGNKMEITCFIVRSNISDTSPLWHEFDGAQNTVALKILSRHASQLTAMPTTILKNMHQLETFIVNDGDIGELKPNAVADLPVLSTLNLERNQIAFLHRQSLFNLPNLVKLTLSENLLTEILADSFSELDEVRSLFLDRNRISRIENCGFCNLHNLRELDLTKNNLTDLTEHAFRGLRYVTRLDLSFNQLRGLNDKVFQGMPRLDDLNLEENVIEYISPRAFYGLDKLRVLKLNYNKLKSLPDLAFQPLRELLMLTVVDNNLETIQLAVIENLHQVLSQHFVFSFAENPLKCGCDLSWIPKYEEKVNSRIFLRILRTVSCTTKGDEHLPVHSMKFDECDGEISSRTVLMNPTLSTLEPQFKEGVQRSNPKYETEFSDSSTLINHTSEKSEIRHEHKSDNNLATKMTINDHLFCFIVFQAIVVTRVLQIEII